MVVLVFLSGIMALLAIALVVLLLNEKTSFLHSLAGIIGIGVIVATVVEMAEAYRRHC